MQTNQPEQLRKNIDSSASVDSSSYIDPTSRVEADVFIGPHVFVGSNCIIGKGTQINPFVVIRANTYIGKNNRIFQFVSLGDRAQIKGEILSPSGYLEIGDNNDIREYVAIHRGGDKKAGTTVIGNGNFIGTYSHIGHDAQVGNDNVFINSKVGGHVQIANNVLLSSSTSVHQFCFVGSYAFICANTAVRQHVLPGLMVDGGVLRGVNKIGLQRNGFEKQDIREFFTIVRKHYFAGTSEAEILQKFSAYPHNRLCLLFATTYQQVKNDISLRESGLLRKASHV